MEVTERKRRGPQENVRKIGSGKLRRQEKLIATLRDKQKTTRCLHARKTFILKILKHVSSKINKFWLNTLRICGDLFDLVHNT